MTKGRKKWLVAGVSVTLLVTAGALAYRGLGKTRIIPATPEEVARITGTDLDWKPWKTAHPVPKAAFKVISKPEILQLARYTTSAGIIQHSAQIRATWPQVEALTAKLKTGVLEAPPLPMKLREAIISSSDMDWNSARRAFSKLIALHIRLEMSLGNPGRCLAAIEAAQSFHSFMWRTPPAGDIDYLVIMACDSILFRAIEEAVHAGMLTFEDLRELYGNVEPARLDDARIRAVFAHEWTYFTKPLIVEIPNDANYVKTINQNVNYGNEGLFMVGSLDTPKTLAKLAEISRKWMANTARPWALQDRSADSELRGIEARLPKIPDLDGNRFRDWWDATLYKAQASSIDNFLGLRTIVDASTTDIVETTFRCRTVLEAHRLTLLLEMYRRSHRGALPTNLDELKSLAGPGGLPQDFFGGSDFMYDYTRRIFWSVGSNGVDDGGLTGLRVMNGQDIVWPAG